jgi:hypothetical protein
MQARDAHILYFWVRLDSSSARAAGDLVLSRAAFRAAEFLLFVEKNAAAFLCLLYCFIDCLSLPSLLLY